MIVVEYNYLLFIPLDYTLENEIVTIKINFVKSNVFYRSSNSVQSPSNEITSTKRHLSPEPQNLVSTDIASNHTTSNKNDKIIPSSGNDKHKRKSMSDVVIVRGKLTTYSSIKNDLRYADYKYNLFFSFL